MKKGKLIGRIFGIVLVAVMIASTLGGMFAGMVYAGDSDVHDNHDVAASEANNPVPCVPCGQSNLNLSENSTDSEWSTKPVLVNIQVDLEKEGDQEYVYDILDQIELRNGRTTVFVTGEFAATHPDIIRSIESRGHQIAVHGWQKGEDLTLLNYADQLSSISRAFAAVRGPVGKPEEVVDFKPQGYKFNDDTIRVAQELGAKSVSGIFTCQEPFCKCPYAQKLGKITFPYPVTNNFWLVPISDVKIDSSDTPLDDEYIDNAQEFLDYLIAKYNEQLQTKDPLIIAIHPSITGADAAKLNAVSQFIDYVTNNDGRIKPLSSLTHLTTYIPSLQITSGPQSAHPGETITITVQFGAAIYCPSYYFRIYGKHPSEGSWTLKAEHYHGVQTGTFSFSRSFTIPEPPPGDSSYTVRVVGQGCSGTCWPTPYSYERMDEVTVQIEEGLVAGFAYSPYPPYNPVVKEKITFDASSSRGAITNYRWELYQLTDYLPYPLVALVEGADRKIIDSSMIPYGFPEGSYLVRLTVADSKGAMSTHEDTLTVKKAPVVLVHGFQKDSPGFEQIEQIWGVMKEELESEFVTHVSHYANDMSTTLSIRQYALNLRNEIEKWRTSDQVNRVDIVAHSMGGLVSRYYIEVGGGCKHVRKLIMLETPNQGANDWLVPLVLAGYDPWIEALLASLEVIDLPEPLRNAIILANLSRALGEYIGTVLGIRDWNSVKDMDSSGQFMKALNQNYLLNHKGKVDYSNLGGWLFTVPYVKDLFKLDGAYYECLHGLTDLRSGYHGLLPRSAKVISKVKFILNDDPAENTENNSADQGLGIQFAPSIVDVVSPGQQNSHALPIGSAAVVNFMLLWSRGDLDLTLVTPSGISIDPSYAEGDPNVAYYGDDDFGIVGYVIKSPESGTWNATMTAINVTGEQSYTLETFLDTDETLSMELEKYQYSPNEMITVTAKLSHNGEPMTDASVIAEIERPDGSVESIILHDDGSHNDSEANDGMYGNIYGNTNLLGGYDLTVVATGVHEDRQFARQSVCTAWVGEYPELTLLASDISFSDNAPGPGQVVTINAAIHNIGSAEALNASILFYDGEPQTESLIGEAVGNVPAGGVADVASQWMATVGTHIIYAVVSPYNAFLEEDYTNNYACKMIDVLEPPALTGTVTDNNGNPAADVYIYAIGPATTSTVTDINGSYTITGLQSGSYTIRVESLSPNLMLTSTSIFLNTGQIMIRNFTLQAVGSIAGNVTDAAGIPIPNVSLYLSGYETARYRTDDSVHYVIPRLQAGTYTVNVDASETIFTDASATVTVVLGQTTTLDFTLPVFAGGQIAGRVTDENGNGVFNAYVSVSGPSWSSDYTDAAGYYFIPRLPAGHYTVTVSPPYGANLVPSSTTAEVIQGEITTVDFVLQTGGRISGRVTDGNGEGISWAYIYADGPSYRSTYTDEEGYYSISKLLSGNYTVEAYPPYGVNLVPSSTMAEVIQGETTIVDFVLETGGTISGHVYRSDGTTPIEGAWVYANLVDGGYGREATTAPDGSYTITSLVTGQYRVQAYAEGYIEECYDNVYDYNEATPVSVSMPDDTPGIDFALGSGGTISGHVYQSDGITPIEGAWIYASQVDDGHGGTATTSADGSYTITTLRTGQYRVEAYAGGYLTEYYDNVYDYSEATLVSVTMPDDTPNIDFTLDLGGTISGHVYQSDGTTPIEGAEVYAELIGGDYDRVTNTAPDGSYTVTTLRTGQYLVWASAGVYLTEYYDNVYDYDQATPVSVTMPDDTPNIDFTLDLGGTISGHVYQSDGTTPIEGAEVYADLIDGGYGMWATSASDGSYTITGLVTGEYHVEAYAEGYVREYYDNVYDYDQATPVSVTMPDDTPGIDFTLDLGGAISGHVYQSDGTTPIEGAWVYAYPIDDGYGMGASTAFDGSYTITGLMTGQYRVRAYAEGYVREYYDGVYDYAQATPVSVSMPDDTPGIDFTLGSGGTISGHVYQSDGTTPVEGAWVHAELIDGWWGRGTTTYSDGSYTITGLVTGEYHVEAYAEGYVREYYDGVYDYAQATPVSVTMPDDTPDIDFTLDLGGTISGHVYQSDGTTPIEGAEVYADLIDGGYGRGANTAPNGSYTITGLVTGQYRVRAYAEEYIEEYYDSVYDYNEATPVSVTMPDDTPNIDFTLDSGGTISGHVYQSDGTTPIEGVWVYAELVGGGYGMGATTASDGSYTITTLRTGQYRVRAYAEEYIEEYYDGVYDYSEATPVSVTMPDDTPDIDFTLDLGGTISGHVYQSDGTTPIEGAKVYAYLIDGGWGRGATTYSDGSYTITTLVTGQYRVQAYGEGYIGEYYDGVYEYSEATPVSVTMPDDTPNIDFTLDLGGTISGHVYQSDGTTPIEGAWVYAELIDGGWGRGTATDSDGSYTITTLVTGQYRVQAYGEGYIGEYYDGVYDYSEATPVSVTMPDDTPDIDFTLDLGGTISGHVYQSDGTTPIEGAWVYANLVDGGYGRGTTTASDGSYTITTLRTGQYRVRAYGEGYIGEYYDNVYEESQATPVSVTMPDDTPGIDFTLDLGGTISGQVYQSDGTTPIEGAWVSAYLIDGGYDSGAITASDGSYTITTLITGQYRVRAYSEGYIEEYYDSVYDYNEATPVSVTMPDDTPGIDFTLDLGGTISGHIYQSDGITPVEGAWVIGDLIDGGHFRVASTASDGSYTIAGLITGEYWVRAGAEGYIAEYYDNVYDYNEATPVSVTMPDDTPGIDFTLDLGGTISGHVYQSDGITPVEGAWVYANLVDGGYGRGTTTASDGSYTITTLITGQYRVRAYPPYGFNLVPSSTTAEVFEAETTTVDFVLQAGGIIAGRVTNEAGEGVPGAYVYADGPSYGSANTDEGGYYSIIRLETGNYTVRIYSQDCSQWYISVNNTLVRYGISVLAGVVCGETTQVDFTQQPQPVPDIRVVPSSFNLTLPQGSTTDRTLVIGNDGVEVLDFGITARVGVSVTDPNEGGEIDIKQIFTSADSEGVNFLVEIYGDLSDCDWIWSYQILWLDTDQDPSTGLTEEYAQDWGVAGLNDIGADYALEVSNSQAYLYKWIGEDHWFEPVSSLPVNVNGSYLSLSIPLSEIDDDGILDYTLWQYGSDDIVPDDGHGTTKVLADWLSVLPVSGTVDPDDQTEMAVTVNATALEIGEYVGYVVIESNDLDESVTYIPVNLTVYLPIEASIDFQPDLLKLNPKAKGGFVETYIELPPGYDVRQIDISSIKFNGIVPALPKPTKVGDHDKDGIPDLMVKFSGAAVQSLLTPGDQIEITVTGEVAGIAFEGTDTIRVTNK